MRYEWLIATRFLRQGRLQSVLIFAGAAMGIGVLVFLTALIDGLQARIIARTLGSQAHVVLRAPDEVTRPLRQEEANQWLVPSIQQPPQRLRSIEQWQPAVRAANRHSAVTAVAPVVRGPGFAVRGRANYSVDIIGVNPESYRNIIDIPSKIIRGEFVLEATDLLIGTELASDLGVSVGQKIRLASADEETLVLIVRGIYDLGNIELNRRWVMVSLRNGQFLHAMPGGATAVEMRVQDIFAANAVADSLHAQTGLRADSWMRTNVDLLDALEGQSRSSTLINTFVVLTVALGIASVLIISVVQRSRQIGILRATGTPSKAVSRVFLLQGGLVGLFGAVLGSVIGTGLALMFERLGVRADGTPVVAVQLSAQLYVMATLIALACGLVAAALPARRAAALDPAKAIHDV